MSPEEFLDAISEKEPLPPGTVRVLLGVVAELCPRKDSLEWSSGLRACHDQA
jgi:hypothetical protein